MLNRTLRTGAAAAAILSALATPVTAAETETRDQPTRRSPTLCSTQWLGAKPRLNFARCITKALR